PPWPLRATLPNPVLPPPRCCVYCESLPWLFPGYAAIACRLRPSWPLFETSAAPYVPYAAMIHSFRVLLLLIQLTSLAFGCILHPDQGARCRLTMFALSIRFGDTELYKSPCVLLVGSQNFCQVYCAYS